MIIKENAITAVALSVLLMSIILLCVGLNPLVVVVVAILLLAALGLTVYILVKKNRKMADQALKDKLGSNREAVSKIESGRNIFVLSINEVEVNRKHYFVPQGDYKVDFGIHRLLAGEHKVVVVPGVEIHLVQGQKVRVDYIIMPDDEYIRLKLEYDRY